MRGQNQQLYSLFQLLRISRSGVGYKAFVDPDDGSGYKAFVDPDQGRNYQEPEQSLKNYVGYDADRGLRPGPDGDWSTVQDYLLCTHLFLVFDPEFQRERLRLWTYTRRLFGQ